MKTFWGLPLLCLATGCPSPYAIRATQAPRGSVEAVYGSVSRRLGTASFTADAVFGPNLAVGRRSSDPNTWAGQIGAEAVDVTEHTSHMVYKDELIETHVLEGRDTFLTYAHHDGALYVRGIIFGTPVAIIWPDEGVESWKGYHFNGMAGAPNPPMPQFLFALLGSYV